MSTRETISTEMRAAAARAGRSQAEIAAMIGISPMRMSRIMRGEKPVSVEELIAFAAAVGTSVSALMPTSAVAA